MGGTSNRTPLVLIVDDDVDFARLLTMRLRSADIDTEHTETALGLSARLLAQPTVDLVMLDCMMPALTGPVVIELLAKNPRLSTIPVVLMSALPDFRAAVQNHPHAVFVEKTGRTHDIIDVVQSMLHGTATAPRPSL